MGRGNSLGTLVLCLLCVSSFTECAPVENTDEVEIEFVDDWDYKIEPHSTPLLNSSKSHLMPVAYSYENDLTIEKLNDNTPQPFSSRSPKRIGDVVRSRVSCGVCKLGVGLLQKEVKMGTPFDEIKQKFVNLCVSFKIANLIVCNGLFDMYGPEVVPALNLTQIGAPEICSLMFGESCGETNNPLHEWKVQLPDIPKPDVITPPLPKLGLPTFKVLHISDTHFDPEYSPGSPNNCEEPLCCRSYSTPTEGEPIIPAGKWGSYKKCDSPKILVENMLENIAKDHPDIDYIIWTGDLPPHDIWNQSKRSNLEIIQQSVDLMSEMFPNTPIFAAVGNHESSPAGNFPPPWMKNEDHAISWLYSQLNGNWAKWLPEQMTNTILHGAFYSVLLRPGFRIIALNTNYCHTLSWWLYVNSTDPSQELKWLIHELQLAESKGEKVHIIGHIPPGASDCMRQWSELFNEIVNRYEATVVAQFYGHSHADEFEVFYEAETYSKKSALRKTARWWKTRNTEDLKFTDRATGIAYLGPSVTTYEDFNPAYRIYYVDGDHENTTREVLDHETWTMDLEHANNGNDPIWFKLYSAKDAFQMESLRPSEWSNLIDRMVTNKEQFEHFYNLYYRGNPRRPYCDEKCRLQILCDLKSAKSQSRRNLCHELELAFVS